MSGTLRTALAQKNPSCGICMKNKPLSDIILIKGCSHSYCSRCVDGYVAAKVEQNVAVIACPAPLCKDGTFEPELCQPMLARKVFDRWCDVMLMDLAEKKGWKRCPRCRFYVEKHSGYFSMSCRCGQIFCYNCGTTMIATGNCDACKH